MERYLDSFEINQTMEDGTFLLDASGSTIIQVLYFVGQNIPVLAYTGEGTSMYLTGYDQTHVRVYHPESGATEVLSMETANQVLGAAGYDFICCSRKLPLNEARIKHRATAVPVPVQSILSENPRL